jgi:hypothetical protein
MDMKDFNAKFRTLAQNTIPALARKGMFIAASEMLHDADTKIPKTPKDKGDLKGSKLIKIGVEDMSNIIIEAGFNIEYASYVHELVRLEAYGEKGINWSEPGSGAKYLESKLTMYGRKYLSLLNDAIVAGGMRA